MEWREERGYASARKAAFKAGVDAGRTPGLIAYSEGRPVAWVAIAPREDHVRLERSRQYGPEAGDTGIFALTCFYVEPELRSTGVSSVLLDAAVEYARTAGATAVDAFPKLDVAPHVLASRRAEENYSWMGRLQSFESRGFVAIRTSGKRAVMRLTLDSD
jgi:GNAT superfamily N-acetyltransferase